MSLNESHVEAAALDWFRDLGYVIAHGPDLAPGERTAERESFADVVLVDRLRTAVARLNQHIPAEAQDEAVRKVLRIATPSLVPTNRTFHAMLRDGVEVEYRRSDGSIAGDHVRLIDFADTNANDWLAVNQFTVIEGQHNRRPDIVIFVNGLPLSVIELKNATDENATIWSAFNQLQTYQAQIPGLFHYNEVLVVSDGTSARIGSLTANQEWFKVWRTIDGEGDAPKSALELEVLLRGVFEPQRFLDLLQHFIVFDVDPDSGRTHKIIAGYHQFHAVNAAVEETVRASGMEHIGRIGASHGAYWSGRMHGGTPGDRRAGVVWHTQGSGKSFSMLFYAARLVRHPTMQNPTLVILTDRNDLDDQLFGQFQRCADILGQTPVQAEDRDALRDLLQVASGGVVFTTIQKFLPEKGQDMPELSARQNIVVIADEAHRSQYDVIDARAGALDALAPGLNRAQVRWIAQQVGLERHGPRSEEDDDGMVQRLFPVAEPVDPTPPPLEPRSTRADAWDRWKILGFLPEGHPIWFFNRAKPRLNCRNITVGKAGSTVTVTAWSITRKQVEAKPKAVAGQRSGPPEPMAFVTFEDDTGLIETVWFPAAYRAYGELLDREGPLRLTGLVEATFGCVSLTVQRAEIVVRPNGLQPNTADYLVRFTPLGIP